MKKILIEIYDRLFERYGRQHWWPADTPFEVIIGAILTQNTSWTNVEKAIKNLKKDDALSPETLMAISEKNLAVLIHPSGYYNIKAGRIKSFLDFLYEEYDGELKNMFKEKLAVLRNKLLTVNGIGNETADSILLYAGGYPIFVIDNYTKKIMSRHQLVDHDIDYPQLQSLFMDNLKHDADIFNEYHALFVRIGKEVCKKTKPLCDECPICEMQERRSKGKVMTCRI